MIVGVAFIGATYGALCFIAGAFFGAIRELALIPAFGKATGHLIEFLLMLVAVGMIARLLVHWGLGGSTMWVKLGAGIIGVIVLVVIESAFAVAIMGVPLATYLAG